MSIKLNKYQISTKIFGGHDGNPMEGLFSATVQPLNKLFFVFVANAAIK